MKFIYREKRVQLQAGDRMCLCSSGLKGHKHAAFLYFLRRSESMAMVDGRFVVDNTLPRKWDEKTFEKIANIIACVAGFNGIHIIPANEVRSPEQWQTTLLAVEFW
jgi:hypothetical protein